MIRTEGGFVLLFLLTTILLSGCVQDEEYLEPEECLPPTVLNNTRIEQDTLRFGTWNYAYSLKLFASSQYELTIVDTVYPNDEVQGFETVNYATVVINDKEILVTKNGLKYGGCYKYWRSNYLTINEPADTIVYCLFHDVSGIASYVGMAVYLSPLDQQVTHALIDTRFYGDYDEEGEVVLYRDYYVPMN